jgi:hypothetical protein
MMGNKMFILVQPATPAAESEKATPIKPDKDCQEEENI